MAGTQPRAVGGTPGEGGGEGGGEDPKNRGQSLFRLGNGGQNYIFFGLRLDLKRPRGGYPLRGSHRALKEPWSAPSSVNVVRQHRSAASVVVGRRLSSQRVTGEKAHIASHQARGVEKGIPELRMAVYGI